MPFYTFIDNCVAYHVKHWLKEYAFSNTNMKILIKCRVLKKSCLKESSLMELTFLTKAPKRKQQGQNKC